MIGAWNRRDSPAVRPKTIGTFKKGVDKLDTFKMQTPYVLR